MGRFDHENLGEYDIQEGPVYWSDDRKLRIDQVNSPKKAYLKVYKAKRDAFNIYAKSTKMCRLSLDDLSYVDGVGSNWILTDEEMNQIKEILASPCKSNINLTVLEYIKECYRQEFNLNK